MKFIGLLIAAAAACWVYYDAKKRGYYTFAAICWMIGTIFLAIVFIPLYLFARGNRRFNINLGLFSGGYKPGGEQAASISESNRSTTMDTKTVGIVMLVVGVIGLVGVYSMRPPSGFGDAIMMMGQGRQHFIREPLYNILLAVFGIISFFGVLKIVKGQKEN